MFYATAELQLPEIIIQYKLSADALHKVFIDDASEYIPWRLGDLGKLGDTGLWHTSDPSRSIDW